eukprot:495316-Amphidinium_carterae.1
MPSNFADLSTLPWVLVAAFPEETHLHSSSCFSSTETGGTFGSSSPDPWIVSRILLWRESTLVRPEQHVDLVRPLWSSALQPETASDNFKCDQVSRSTAL